MSELNCMDPFVHLVTSEDLEGDAKKIFENIKATTGKVPKWMKVMGNSPEILIHFFRLFQAIMKQGEIDSLLKWKVAFKVSELNKCEFCVSVTKMKLRCLGLSEKEISEIDQAMTEKEKVVLAFAEASTKHAYRISPKLKNQVKLLFNDREIVELTSAVGLFNFINRFNDTLDVLPDVN